MGPINVCGTANIPTALFNFSFYPVSSKSFYPISSKLTFEGWQQPNFCNSVPSSLYQWHHKEDWHVWQKYQMHHTPFSALHWWNTNQQLHNKIKIKAKKHFFCINTKQKQNYFLAVKRFPCKLAYLNVRQSNRRLSCGLHNHILPLPLGAGWDVVSARFTANQEQVPLFPGGADFRGAGAVVTATGHVQQLQDEAGVAHNALGHEHHVARAQRCSYLEWKELEQVNKCWRQDDKILISLRKVNRERGGPAASVNTHWPDQAFSHWRFR